MSFCGRQSRILFSISASFVIFGSTVAIALPPQGITEEVTRAKPFPMISNGSNALTVYLRTNPIRQMRRTSQRMKGIGPSRRANRERMAVRKLWRQI